MQKNQPPEPGPYDFSPKRMLRSLLVAVASTTVIAALVTYSEGCV